MYIEFKGYFVSKGLTSSDGYTHIFAVLLLPNCIPIIRIVPIKIAALMIAKCVQVSGGLAAISGCNNIGETKTPKTSIPILKSFHFMRQTPTLNSHIYAPKT